jgi:hypothetical protein
MNVRHRPEAWLAALVSSLLLLTGCASEVALAPDVDKSKPKLVLSQGEFRVVGTVTGRASCPYLLYIDLPDSLLGRVGIPGTAPPVAFALGDAALHVRAMEDLHRQHDLLGKPQILHHFVEEWTLANYLGLFAIKRLTITAEVLEFVEKGR